MVSSITSVSALTICCRVDRLKIKQQITDAHIMQILKYHPQSCHGINQSVDRRAPSRCRLKILLGDFVDAAKTRLLPCNLVFWNLPTTQHKAWPTEEGMETPWRNLLLDGVTASSAGLLARNMTWNNLLMQIWNLFFCWRSWCEISKLHLQNSFGFVFLSLFWRYHPVTLVNSCVHLNFSQLLWHFRWI